jgi:hypothetical protein
MFFAALEKKFFNHARVPKYRVKEKKKLRKNSLCCEKRKRTYGQKKMNPFIVCMCI